MGAFQIHDTVGEIVVRRPVLSRVFEQADINFCCGGKKTLEEACREKGLDPQSFLTTLEESASAAGDETGVDPSAMSLVELADDIERTHHAYLRSELPRLGDMAKRVAAVHGGKDPCLHQVRGTVLALAGEMSGHIMKEERMLFPMVRLLEESEITPDFYFGSLANPIRQMEQEHDQAGSALEKLRELTDAYTPPDWACGTYRAMLNGLAQLERDTHQHFHKENNVLFPRALEMEVQKQQKVAFL